MKMEIHTNSWMVRQISRMITNKGILFDYPIQRLADQWSLEQKSDFIHTLAQDYPVPPIYFLKEDTVETYETNKGEVKQRKVSLRQTLDGKQRLTTAHAYVLNEFKLSDKTDTVYIEGEEYDIAGCYFEELPEPVKDAIESKMISTYNIDAATASDEQIEDLFFRMNNGTSLTVQQKSKALMGKEWASRFNKLITHPFFVETSAFSKTQLRSEGHISSFIQAMMMKENLEITMSQGKIADYSEALRNRSVEDTNFESLKRTLDFLYLALGEKRIPFLKRVNVPMVLVVANTTTKQEEEFGAWFDVFVNDLTDALQKQKEIDALNLEEEEEETEYEALYATDFKTDYHLYLGTGSTTPKKVYGRLKAMQKHHNAYLTENVEATTE